MTEPFLSYAQTGEDVLLWRALGEWTPGFYIDAGASDPSFLSVTRALYERGWRGIDIEPLPAEAARLREARPRDIVIEAALSDAPGQATLWRVDIDGDTGLSSMDREAVRDYAPEPVAVQVTTLDAVCRAHVRGEVHFLKIDVEGAEAAVLRGMDLRAVRPWIVLVEATRPHTGEAAADWEGLLIAADYVFVWFDGLNRFYVAAERHAALAPHFTVPPNPFDRFEIYDAAGIADRAKLDALARGRLARIGALEAELAEISRPPPPQPPPPEPPPPPPAPPPPGLMRALVRRVRLLLLGSVPAELAAIREQQSIMHARLDQAMRESAATTIDAKLADAIGRALQTSVAPMLDEKLADAIDRALQALVVERDG